jgi:uncharacterized protein YciI
MFAIEIIVKDSLYAVKYTEEKDEFENNEFDENYKIKDEFSRLFINWQDPEYLDRFFNKHKKDLQKEFYNNISIEDAIQKTIDEAYEFQQKILSIAEKGKENFSQSLQTLFVPLHNSEKEVYPIPEYQKSKAYGSHKSWLRIYAIRIEKNVFIVTGGAIKLTKTMNEREHLIKELKKLEKVKELLISEGIIDNDSIVDFLELQF